MPFWKRTDFHEAAMVEYLGNIRDAAENEFEYAGWYSWAAGAGVVFEGLKKIPGAEAKPDSLEKAKRLLELCMQPMISFWYHNWDSQESHTEKEKETTRQVSFENVQTFFGISSESLVRLHLSFDKELQWYLNGKRDMPIYYVAMFYQRCRECIAGENLVDWDKLQFPIDSHEQFLSVCHKGKYRDFKDPIVGSAVAWALIARGTAYMYDEFRRLSNIRGAQ